jgi:hypothetical protein
LVNITTLTIAASIGADFAAVSAEVALLSRDALFADASPRHLLAVVSCRTKAVATARCNKP